MIDPVKLLVYGMEYFGLYYGTYKGQVVDTSDPMGLGRIVVHCPTIHGPTYPTTWATPVSPMAGKNFGIWHVPDAGEWVHVRFDHGRVEFPMWEGGWWGQGDPTTDMVPTNVVLCTKEGYKIVIDRTAGSILIDQGNGNNVLIDGDAVTINHSNNVTINAQSNVDIAAQGEVNITAQSNVTVTGSPDINLVGAVLVTGTLSATEAVTAGTATLAPVTIG